MHTFLRPLLLALLLSPPWGRCAEKPLDLARKPREWFASPEGRAAVANVLANQSARGDWPKNVNTAEKRLGQDPAKVEGTFDNGATTGELRLLARAAAVTGEETAKRAVERGIDHILAAQYPTGGWPQFFPPPGKKYHRHITFNDACMVNLMRLLRDAAAAPDFAFLGEERRARARAAFDRGVDCILKCQITVNGRKTVWCAQHDELTLEPRPARSFELASLSGGESAGILALLMELPDPSPAAREAVHAGAAWYEASALRGQRVVVVDGDKRMQDDPEAPPLWARFYRLDTGKPFFCGRDGIARDSVAEIESERRNGYAWHGNWGDGVAKAYADWSKRHPR